MSHCLIADENVDVIYICPKHLGDNILQYYTSILKCDEATYGTGTRTSQASSPCKRRFIILTPEAVDYFPVRFIIFTNLFGGGEC